MMHMVPFILMLGSCVVVAENDPRPPVFGVAAAEVARATPADRSQDPAVPTHSEVDTKSSAVDWDW